MGLDMYLDRYPRYKGYSPTDFNIYDEYLNYGKDKPIEEYYSERGYRLPPVKDRAHFGTLRHTSYSEWDTEHKYPHTEISENVMYWRKANAIHQWFVDTVQNGEDDCDIHDEVTEELLTELRDKCATILENCVMMQGKVANGYTCEGGKWKPILEDGMFVANPEVCEEELPTTSGFFFGSTNYDQWYIDDIRETYEACERILKETDFETQALYYCSSW